MPVEIKEMMIRATINNCPNQSQQENNRNTSGSDRQNRQTSAIVEQCLEQVMESIRRDQDR
jgi:hypothetical protein